MKTTTWSIQGFVLYNAKADAYVAMREGLPVIIHNLLDAYLFATEEEAFAQVSRLGVRRYGEYQDDDEVMRQIDERTNPKHWEVREAKLTATHK
jgi:hypothetical protein